MRDVSAPLPALQMRPLMPRPSSPFLHSLRGLQRYLRIRYLADGARTRHRRCNRADSHDHNTDNAHPCSSPYQVPESSVSAASSPHNLQLDWPGSGSYAERSARARRQVTGVSSWILSAVRWRAGRVRPAACPTVPSPPGCACPTRPCETTSATSWPRPVHPTGKQPPTWPARRARAATQISTAATYRGRHDTPGCRGSRHGRPSPSSAPDIEDTRRRWHRGQGKTCGGSTIS